MPELTLVLVVVGMLVLQAAAVVALVIVGVRLAIGAPILPGRERWARWLRTTIARVRHYDGSRV